MSCHVASLQGGSFPENMSPSILHHAVSGNASISIIDDTSERAERGSKPGIVFSQIQPGHRIKNWKRILASTETKAKLAKFMAENWKELRQREKLHDVILMVTSGERCFKLTKMM